MRVGERLLKFLAAGGHSCVIMSLTITPTLTCPPAIFPVRMAGEPNNPHSYDSMALKVDHSGSLFSSEKNIQRHLDETCTL